MGFFCSAAGSPGKVLSKGVVCSNFTLEKVTRRRVGCGAGRLLRGLLVTTGSEGGTDQTQQGVGRRMHAAVLIGGHVLGPAGALAWSDEACSPSCAVAGRREGRDSLWQNLCLRAGDTVAQRLGTWVVKSERCGGFLALPFISWRPQTDCYLRGQTSENDF